MIEDYFIKTTSYRRPFYSNLSEVPDLVVVIPAYAEKRHLFRTLRSLVENPAREVKRIAALCVINNEEGAEETVRKDNLETINYLQGLISGQLKFPIGESPEIEDDLKTVASSPLRMGYIDAASPGLEIPKKERGAGTARKIGMDMALRLMYPSFGKKGLIVSLDADTTVARNYLSSLQAHRSGADLEAFIVDYEHVLPSDPFLSEAICNYEIFLRYYVLGLELAHSPYAYHVMGSAMVVTTGVYLAVRGMSRRAAGEDFYFLNKIAKICPIKRIRSTKVYPSARISKRVPFGTGASLSRRREMGNSESKFYHPKAFLILAEWLKSVEELIIKSKVDATKLMEKALSIHGVLADFLKKRQFPAIWERICMRTPESKEQLRRFHEWFDAFQTLKLIRALHEKAFPMVGIEEAWSLMRSDVISILRLPPTHVPESNDHWVLLNFLRSL